MSFSPFPVREEGFVDHIIDYTIPISVERSVVLTLVNNQITKYIFTYFSVFDLNVWSLLLISMLLIVLILSLFYKICLIRKQLSFEIVTQLFLKLYGGFLTKGILSFLNVFN